MHRGGIAGLRPGEVPAILQTGELVVPRGALQQEAAAPVQEAKGDTFVVNVNGVSDFDSFRHSQGRILGMLGEAVELARRRHM